MKKLIQKFWIPVMLVLIAGCVGSCLVSLLVPQDPIKLARSISRVQLPKGTTIVTNNDTGPGLPIPGGASDGYVFLVAQIPAEKIMEFTSTLENSPDWKPLPVPAEFAEHERVLQPSIAGGIDENIPINTSTGYYLFIDHQAEYNKRVGRESYAVATPFYDRPSYNFTFCLFNDQDGKLYLWSLDT